MNKFRLTGKDESIGNFFEVCRAFGNSMPMYESIVISSWPFAGNRNWGMSVQINDKLKNATGAARVIAKACGVEMVPLSDHEEQFACRVARLETSISACHDWIKEVLEMHRKGHITCTGMDWERVRRLLNDV